jgi:hypothetical protein
VFLEAKPLLPWTLSSLRLLCFVGPCVINVLFRTLSKTSVTL